MQEQQTVASKSVTDTALQSKSVHACHNHIAWNGLTCIHAQSRKHSMCVLSCTMLTGRKARLGQLCGWHFFSRYFNAPHLKRSGGLGDSLDAIFILLLTLDAGEDSEVGLQTHLLNGSRSCPCGAVAAVPSSNLAREGLDEGANAALSLRPCAVG